MSRNYTEFTEAFERYDIDPAKFAHLDHIGVALEMLRKYDFLTAAAKYSDCISTIATQAGADRKFNTTITLAFLSLIAERSVTSPHKDFDDFITRNPDLLSAKLLAKWYSGDRLNTDLARSVFLMPDVAA